MINIYTEFTLENKYGLFIEGTMLIPYTNGMFYKPHTITILSGQLDDNHNKNNGYASISLRDYKNSIISQSTVKSGPFHEIKEPFIFEGGKSTGAIGFASKMTGINTNREVGLRFSNNNLSGKKIAKILQNPSSFKGPILSKIIHIDSLPEEDMKYLYGAEILENENVVSVSSKMKEVKND